MSRRVRIQRQRGQLSRRHAGQAAAHGAAARTAQARALRRAVPVTRDTELTATSVTTRLVRHAAAIIDRDPDLVGWVADKVVAAQKGKGRPPALCVRSALICFWLLNITQRNFHLLNLPALLSGLSWRARRHLGIDYLDRYGRPRQISYGQLLRVFTNIADAVDPFAPGLSDEQSAQRAADLQELSFRLVRASVDNPGHSGDYAVDATLVWAWDRPPGGLNRKIERRGRDGDAGRPLALSEIVGTDQATDADLTAAGFDVDPLVTVLGQARDDVDDRVADHAHEHDDHHNDHDVEEDDEHDGAGDDVDEVDEDVDESNPATTTATTTAATANATATTATTTATATTAARRSRRRPRTWGYGATWVGRGRRMQKSVYGYALHTAVPTDSGAAPVIEAMAVTPASALPAPATTPLLRLLHDTRSGAGLRPLGDVVADPAYSANTTHWELPIRALGGSAIYRLHATNQAGRRQVRGHTFIDGRPYCSCIPDTLADVAYPKFPYTRSAMTAYQNVVAVRRRFEMLPNANWRANGGRQFRSPHFDANTGTGGCEHCVDAFGRPVRDDVTGRARPRCCSQRTRTFTETELALYQEEVHGSAAWYLRWNRRNRVEGSYGVLKSLALVNWGHDYHHFVGLSRETLVATFAVMAHNFHVQRTFAVRQRLASISPRPRRTLPSSRPTQTTPAGLTAARHARAAAEREAAPRGPKGLEFLGTPPAGP